MKVDYKKLKNICHELELLFWKPPIEKTDLINRNNNEKSSKTKHVLAEHKNKNSTRKIKTLVSNLVVNIYIKCSNLANNHYGNVIEYKKINQFVRAELQANELPIPHLNSIEERVIKSLQKDNISINNNPRVKKKTVIDVKTFKRKKRTKNKFDSTAKKLRLDAKLHFDVRGKLSNHTITSKSMISDSSPFLLNIIGSKSVLKFDDEKKLISMLNSKNKAIYKIAVDRLVNCNLRLIYSIANKYKNRGIEITDLFNEGLIGLYRAISKFDSTRFSNRFSTYATWWIRQAITRAISEQGRLIRLPVHMVDSINLIFRKERELTFLNARSPKTEEIVKEVIKTKTQIFTNKFFEKMGFNYKEATTHEIKKITNCLNLQKTPNKSHIVINIDPKKAVWLAENGFKIPDPIKFKIYKIFEVEKLRIQSQDIINLERSINSENDDSTIADFIEDKIIQKPNEAFNETYIKNYIYKVITTQIPNIDDQKILRMRLGMLPFNKIHTVDKISEISHLSRENVRKSFNSSIEILSQPENREKFLHLRMFLDKK